MNVEAPGECNGGGYSWRIEFASQPNTEAPPPVGRRRRLLRAEEQSAPPSSNGQRLSSLRGQVVGSWMRKVFANTTVS